MKLILLYSNLVFFNDDVVKVNFEGLKKLKGNSNA